MADDREEIARQRLGRVRDGEFLTTVYCANAEKIMADFQADLDAILARAQGQPSAGLQWALTVLNEFVSPDPAFNSRKALEVVKANLAARAQGPGPGEAISDDRAREFVEAAYAPPTAKARELMEGLRASTGPGEAVAVGLLQARHVLKDLHAKHPGCGYDKMANACEIAATPAREST